MNTILITGTAESKPYNVSKISVGFRVEYEIIIWASVKGEHLQFITSSTLLLSGYPDLWSYAKEVVKEYFNNSKFYDGAYTQFLDHITMK